jgi:CxxC-x17-CxxC domain-containing protein
MGNYDRNDRSSGGFHRGGFGHGGGRNFDRGGRPSFGGGRGGDREMFSAVCSNCGKECQVPFKPTGSKPVYCSDCFEKMGGGRNDSRRFDDRSRSPQAQSGPDLSAINAKLDKILNILEPKVVAPTVQAPVVKEEKIVEEIKPEKVEKKAKKTTKKVASEKKK